MKYYVLASGSSGNCTIIDINGKLLMIDIGIAINELESKLNKLGYVDEDVVALIITHDHTDHVRSIAHFKNSIVYGGAINYNIAEKNKLDPFIEYDIKGVKVTPLALSHDSGVCYGYKIEYENETLVYATDLGYFPMKYVKLLNNANYYIFESNHDPRMLMNTKRPMFLKQRILSDYGHLCNEDSSYILTKLIGNNTKEVVLAHISREANTKQLAKETFYKMCKKYEINIEKVKLFVADQFCITSSSISEEFEEVTA